MLFLVPYYLFIFDWKYRKGDKSGIIMTDLYSTTTTPDWLVQYNHYTGHHRTEKKEESYKKASGICKVCPICTMKRSPVYARCVQFAQWKGVRYMQGFSNLHNEKVSGISKVCSICTIKWRPVYARFVQFAQWKGVRYMQGLSNLHNEKVSGICKVCSICTIKRCPVYARFV